MRVLVTGAAGQLSRLVALALSRDGHEVIGVDLRPTRHRDFPGPFERVKRYDHRAVDEIFRARRPEALLHLGIRAGGFQAEARQRYTQNVLGTRHLLDLSRRWGLRRVVVLGTYHVYGAHPNNPTFIREDAPLRAVQNFPELIDAVELDHTVTTFVWQHKGEVPAVLLRPVNLVGPHLRNQVTTLLRAPRCPRLLGFNPMQQFMHESDVVRLLLDLVHGDESAVYNACGEGAVPWRRAIEIAGARSVALPHGLAYPVVRVLARLNVAFPEHLMDFFRYPVITSDAALRARYAWRPRVTVVEALRSIQDVPADAAEAGVSGP
jgi:UDP-glucose 4-epimerase